MFCLYLPSSQSTSIFSHYIIASCSLLISHLVILSSKLSSPFSSHHSILFFCCYSTISFLLPSCPSILLQPSLLFFKSSSSSKPEEAHPTSPVTRAMSAGHKGSHVTNSVNQYVKLLHVTHRPRSHCHCRIAHSHKHTKHNYELYSLHTHSYI